MKLLLRDYIASLRERDELDRVLVPLCIAKGLRIVREPELGSPEHGLDIGAVGPFAKRRRALVLIQVKQGDITRSNWNTGPNAVRQSLDDLLDYLDTFQSLTGAPRPLPVVIVLAHNGHIRSNVQEAFDGYTKRIERKHGIPVVHWHLDVLTDLLGDHLLREELFPSQSAVLLRHLLAYMEVPGYDLRHLTRLVDALLPESADRLSPREIERTLLQVATVLLMVEVAARNDAKDLSVAVRAYELGFLRVFCWLKRQGLIRKPGVLPLLRRIFDAYIRVALELLVRIAPLVEHDDGLARVGTSELIEYPLRCLSVGGLAAQLFLVLLPSQSGAAATEALRFISRFLITFRRTASGATRPICDPHLTEVALLAVSLRAMGRADEAQAYVRSIVESLVFDKVRGLPLPEGIGNLEAVGQLVLGGGKPPDYVEASSCLLTMLAELCVILDLQDEYRIIRERWSAGVNLQQWYPTEVFIDTASPHPPALHEMGSSELGIVLPEDITAFRREMAGRTHLDAPIRKGHTTVPFFEAASYIACRCLGLRLPPFYWRRLAGTAMYPEAIPPKEASSFVPAQEAPPKRPSPSISPPSRAKRRKESSGSVKSRRRTEP